MKKTKRSSFTISLGQVQKSQIQKYFNGSYKQSTIIVDLTLAAIAMKKVETIKVPATGSSTNLSINCPPDKLKIINQFVKDNKLNKSQWIVGLLYETMT